LDSLKLLPLLVVFVVAISTLCVNHASAAGTSVYENLSEGFLLEYPDDWQVIELEDPVIKAMIAPPTENPEDPLDAISMILIEQLALEIDLFDYSELAMENLESSLGNFKLIDELEVSLGGIPAKKIKFTGLNEFDVPVTGTYVWTIKDNKAFLILFMADSTTYTKYSQTGKMIEDSFKFKEGMPKVILGDYSDPDLGLEVEFPDGWIAVEFTTEALEFVGETKSVMSESPVFSQTGNFEDFVTVGISSIKISKADFEGMLANIEETGCKIPNQASIKEVSGMKSMEFKTECILVDTDITYTILSNSFFKKDTQIDAMFMAGSDQVYEKEFSKYQQFLNSLKIQDTIDVSNYSEMAALFGEQITHQTVSTGEHNADITISSTSAITDFIFDEKNEEISFGTSVTSGKADSISIFPDKVLESPYTVTINDEIIDDIMIVNDQTTGETSVSISYESPIQKIVLKGTLKEQFKAQSDSTTSAQIPDWVRGNAEWWAQGAIGDSDFVSGIQYLIKEGIMTIPETAKAEGEVDSKEIPSWIKNNADWWAQGLITDGDFVKGIQFLIENGIMEV